MGTSPAAEPRVPAWTFADHLRKIRTSSGQTQKDFAAALNVSAGTYAQWEADNSRPRDVVAVAKRLELMTGVPAWWTLGLEERPRQDSNLQPTGYWLGDAA